MSEKSNAKDDLQESLVRTLELSLSAVIGKKRMLVQDILKLRGGDVISLDKKISDLIDLYVENVLVARGTLVTNEDGLGIKIKELVESI